MAIKGLSDVVRLPRLGKIRLGERAVNEAGKEYPRATEHFVVPAEVQEVFGEIAPTSLEIMFPVEDQGVFASQFYRSYSRTRGLVCKGDGDRAARLIDVATKTGRADDGRADGGHCRPRRGAGGVAGRHSMPGPGLPLLPGEGVQREHDSPVPAAHRARLWACGSWTPKASTG